GWSELRSCSPMQPKAGRNFVPARLCNQRLVGTSFLLAYATKGWSELRSCSPMQPKENRNMIAIEREPTSPGEILQEEFLLPLKISQKQLADHLGYDVKVINRIVNNRSSVSVEMAVKLGKAFNISAQFWLNAQQSVDIYRVLKNVKNFPQPIVQAS
ncbi:MAG: HigA family addiction module antitoxin, partial [Spirochaetota bacterium]|nr:HigA family addiction module antitoxin [Spirochaetota bacterium]